jgi:hypothetical protein
MVIDGSGSSTLGAYGPSILSWLYPDHERGGHELRFFKEFDIHEKKGLELGNVVE